MERKTIVVNLWGGPCSGKSTTAAGLFYFLKINGYEVELVTEYAKELTWQNHHTVLNNQAYVTSKQINRIHRLLGKVDVIITDSPIPLGIIYAGFGCTPSFKPWILEVFSSFNNLNFLLNRNSPYNPLGRTQSSEEIAVGVDKQIKTLLDEESIPYIPLEVNLSTVENIVGEIQMRVRKENPDYRD